jgi:nitrite reductase (NO-forming)
MTDTAVDVQHPHLRSWPQDAFRIAFGLIWLIDAVLKWLPGFRSTYVSAVSGVAQGQPGWLKWWFDFWVKLQTPRPSFFAYLVAVLETLVALAIIFGFARKLTYVMSAVFGVVIWAVAEGFGGPYGQGASDIGTAIIYAVVSMGLLTLCYYVGASRFSVDYYLERRFSWWWKVAEMHAPGREGQVTPPVATTPPVEVEPAVSSAPTAIEVLPATTDSPESQRPVGVG